MLACYDVYGIRRRALGWKNAVSSICVVNEPRQNVSRSVVFYIPVFLGGSFCEGGVRLFKRSDTCRNPESIFCCFSGAAERAT